MRFRRIRILSLIIALALAVSNITPLTVYAAVAGTRSSEKITLTDLEITDLEEPVVGEAFDTTAVVLSAEGVEWEIPVVWVDEQGRKVSVPVAGKKYFPTFLFYIPDGYKVSDTGTAGSFNIRFPDFVADIYGTDHVIYALEPSSGFTYIFVADDYRWEQYLRGDYVWSEWNEPEKNEPEDPDYENRLNNNETYVPEPEANDPVRLYCSQGAINTLGEEFLNWFIGLVKNTLQPQAVSLLRTGFYESLGKAAQTTELSDKIGLYIFYNDGVIDGEPVQAGTLAFVYGSYKDNSEGENVYTQIMGFDLGQFVVNKNGSWVIDDDKKSELDNTVVHEMLHAFMFDYNRYGMSCPDAYELPRWFMEGIATTVENEYEFRKDDYGVMMGNNEYEVSTVKNAYIQNHGTNSNENLDLSHASDTNNTGSAYVSGYLAVVYLGYLDAVKRGRTVIDQNNDFVMEEIRGGVDNILKRLHGSGNGPGESLDSIINDISNSYYTSTDDYQNKFIKGTGSGEDDSLSVVTEYLNWLEGQTYDDNGTTKYANGSILRQEQNYSSPLSWEGTYVTNLPYRIANESGAVTSSVDDERANLTGGKNRVGDGSNDYADQDNSNNASGKMSADIANEPVEEESEPALVESVIIPDSTEPKSPVAEAPQTFEIHAEVPVSYDSLDCSDGCEGSDNSDSCEDSEDSGCSDDSSGSEDE